LAIYIVGGFKIVIFGVPGWVNLELGWPDTAFLDPQSYPPGGIRCPLDATLRQLQYISDAIKQPGTRPDRVGELVDLD
jgi:hypothetical protein